MAMRWTVFQAIAWAEVAAGAAKTTSRSTGTGERRPHSSATMPPSEPPVASARRSTPRCSSSGYVGVGEIGRGEFGERVVVLGRPLLRAGGAVAAAEEVGGHDRVA